MLNLLENLSIDDKLGLFSILCILSILVFSGTINRKIIFDVRQGKIPEALRNFPVHQTHPDSYLETKSKLSHFLDLLAADNKNIELQLNENDLNNLYTKGIQINKYQPGRYFYYTLQEKSICELMFEYPVILSLQSYITRKRIIYFEGLKQYDKVMDEKFASLPLSKSSLILFIFGASKCPAFLSYDFDKTIEYQQAMILIDKLKSIEINDYSLILKA
ncbi:hypothetical protein [Oscillatoria salina]|uniref:hypothetical protein n=1 Tax=Oscillatoria salina TaxID=331517 RepID=UPI001CC9AF4A|nr:hypothetical protein [Oscillatoria salina]MBZ8180919.1 hypothetical protein [Oscillatoria salina IIICB1]